MSILNYIIPFLVVLGPLIFIHELGHFAVAKWLKIRVEVFSLGIGPRLFGFIYGDTDYRVSAIPLGGYVKMKGETLDEEIEGSGDEFLARPKWQRFLVLLAGPLMNIVLAIAIPMGLAMFYFHAPAYLNEPVVVGSVALGSAGEQAGIQPGDRVILFGDTKNPTWRQVNDSTIIHPGQPLPVTIIRNNQELSLTLTPSRYQEGGEIIGDSGLIPTDWQPSPLTVQTVQSGSPAEVAGLKPNDKIIKFNNQPVVHFEWFKDSIKNFDNQIVTLDIERGGQPVSLKVTPHRDPDGKIRIGFSPAGPFPTPRMITVNKSIGEALKYAVDENWRIIVMTKDAFAQMLSGHRNVKDSLAGPIGIAEISFKSYQIGGVEGVLIVMGVLSLNLGVFNLLPIPVLDGGHIFIIFLESLCGLIGVKVTTGFKEKLMQTGFVLLVLLMGYVIYNDFAKKFSSRPISDPPKVQSTQPTPPQPAPAGTGSK